MIGLGIAWRLAAKGATVDVFDRAAAGSGASYAAAGMLAACCEAEPGEDALVALGRDSQARWPAFAAELLQASGVDVELRQEGTLVVALTADDQARIHHHLAHQKKLGLPLEWISAAETRRREPHLAGKLAGAVWSPEDHQVDNRKLAAGLRIAAEAAGATIHEHTPVKEISIVGGRADGVVLADGVKVPADVVVLAAGAWSRGIAGVAPEHRPPVRPIKGQMLALKMDPAAPLINHVIWAPGVYMVPRRDGRLIVGATVEEKAFDTVADRRRAADPAGGGVAHGAVDRGTRHRRDVGRSPSGQPRRRADPRAGSGARADLRHRPSPQRHPARAGDRRRGRASWCSKARSIRRSGRSASSGLRRPGLPNRVCRIGSSA